MRTNIHALSGIQTYDHSDQLIKTYASDGMTTGTGSSTVICNLFLPCLSSPLHLTKLHATCVLSLAYAFTMVTCVMLFSHILLFTVFLFNSISKSKCDVKAKQSKVVRL
jgi:hypothetical protein